MPKNFTGECINFILVAEEPIGDIILVQEYDSYEKARRAYGLLLASKVCLYRQDVRTTVVSSVTQPNRKKGLLVKDDPS